jgi:SAM-dependent methyltransferase
MKDELAKTLEDKFDPGKWPGFAAFKHYKYSGTNLIDEINNLDPDLVIDVGCGHNRFKGHIKNLIGFDREPFPFADIYLGIDEINFRPESADVVLVLGSIQFGNIDLVERHMDKIVQWVKPGGFVVVRAMQDYYGESPWRYQHAHYIWTDKDIEYFTKKYSFTIDRGPWIEEVKNFNESSIVSTRKVWWWKKPGTLKKYSIDLFNCTLNERDNVIVNQNT